MKIEEAAKEIIENIINFYKKNPSKSEINRFVKEQLKNYSEKVKKIVEKELVNILGDFYYTNDDPQIAITPLKLSEMLYKRANILAKEVTKILIDGIKAKETIREIAMKLYEGYGFKDKEVLEAVKVLPKYLQEAIKKRDAEIMKQIEKLKTKPLRIAYKDIVRRFDELSDEELEKFIKTAYYEKMRYYAKRIADTETHRAAMSKRAREYLDDENIEFVRFEMSSSHPKMDICDFYANLDIGYGRGIVPKSEMRTLPLHPHCYDKETEVYTNKGWMYFKDLKGDEEFLSFNPETKEIEFVRAKNFVCWLNTKEMIKFSHKHFDLLVTDKHNMVVYKRKMVNGKRKKFLEFVEAGKCNNAEFSIPRTAIWNGKDKDKIKIMNFEFNTFDFCEFMGYWLSDGSVVKRKYNYQIDIAQQENQQRIFDVIKRMGFKPYFAKRYIGFTSEFGEYLIKFGKAQEKYIPKEIKELEKKYLWRFLKAFVSCDGHIRPEKDFKGYKSRPEYVFYTSSKKMADDIGEIILKCGYHPSFYLQKAKGKEVEFRNGKYLINNDIWIIRLKRSKTAIIKNMTIEKINYNDLVYCVELEKYNILWVRRNGKTCFSGNCHCVYSPYYGKVKGKRKSWNKAVKDTMSKFNEAEQKEILGTYDMLNRFKGGEDIERIFNTVRPKYPIKRYVDIFENKDYNSFMEKYENAILEKFKDFDVSSREKAIASFKGLWRNEDKFFNHIKRRKDLGHIKDEYDYLYKTLKCLADTKKVDLAIYKKSWDNIYFKAKANDWAVIFNEKGELMTSYKIEKNMPQFKEAHKNADEYKEGVKNGLQKYFKQIYDTFRNNTR
jgi:hypothetical protein